MIPLSPALLIACACGRLSGRTTYACTFDRDHRRQSLILPAHDDEAASMRFINAVGYVAHLDLETGLSSWPIPFLDTVQQLACFGYQRRLVHDTPKFGDLVMQWNGERNRFTQVGIVVSVFGGEEGVARCRTLNAHRRGTLARQAPFTPESGDQFLRWVDLDRRDRFGMVLWDAA